MTPAIKLVVFALTAVVLYPLIKSYAPQLALPFAIAVCVGIVLFVLDAGTPIVRWLTQLGDSVDGEAFLCLVKASGIALITEWCCDLCKDSGLTAIAGCIELCGRILMLTAAFPLFQAVYTAVLGLA